MGCQHSVGCTILIAGVDLCCVLLQEELNELVQTWNTHKIRPRPGQDVPGERPVLMYTVPQVFGAEDMLKPVDLDVVAVCKEECTL